MTPRRTAILTVGLGLCMVSSACEAVQGSSVSERAEGATDLAAESVTLDELADWLHGCPAEASPNHEPCVHLVYVWSPSMPLSELGAAEAGAAAGAMGVALHLLPASELRRPAEDSAARNLARALVTAGAMVHYPSLVVMQGDRVAGNALAGYKEADAYAALLPERLSRAMEGERRDAAPHARPDADPGRSGGDLQDIEVVWSHEVSPAPGAFFRHVPGTSFIAYDQRERVYLRDLSTDRSFRGPGWIDFVPSPDGRLFVTPARGSGGLEFYLAGDVLARGSEGDAYRVEPIVTDEQMTDQYPSVGILRSDPGATRYRVLLSWFSGLAFRDYVVRWSEDGTTVTAATAKLQGCPGLDLSIPILSRDGRELAARDEDTGTTKVFAIAENGSCRELFDLGRQTSKVGFSEDGSLIAYSSTDPGSADSGTRSTTYVLDRTNMRTIQVPESESAGLVIPEVIGTDSLLIAVREGARSGSSEFRLLCCMR